jgi:hypothetical protein
MKYLHAAPTPIRQFLATVLVFVFATVGLTVFHTNNASADSFNAGRIIDDSVFTYSNSLNTTQIQSFLNSKVSYCDTNGTQPASDFGRSDLTHGQYAALKGWSGPPYICLKDYSENGKSSAQIINDIAQQYQINPEVLIVLLQKEAGLVTDTWPLSGQYRTAAGYGCPDTAACDSQYYGFTNQLTWAAKMYRAIMNASPTWYTPYILGNNYIQYNPDSSCGGTTVNIQNRATQALYNYTPYQPNAAALASSLGATVPCGAYGNLNFYRYFTSWFGSVTFNTVSAETNAVWRLYNPKNGDHMLSANYQEANIYIMNGWTSDGVISYTIPTGTISVHRMFNPGTNRHTVATGPGISALMSQGWTDDGELFKAPATGTPTWNLGKGNQAFSTANPGEVAAYQRAGWVISGIIYYSPSQFETPIYRLYNPIKRTHVLVTDPNELTAYMRAGWINDGPVFSSSTSTDSVPVYRLWNGFSHFMTASAAERDVYVSAGWKNDGVIFYASPDTSGVPVYRLWNGASHFMTASAAERDVYVSAGWKNDGIVFYISNAVAAHRLYNSATGAHKMAISPDTIHTAINQGWSDDGSAFVVSSGAGAAVYELANPTTGSYFYTANASELSTYQGAGWQSNGVLFYAPASGLPIYRLYDPTSQTHILIQSNTEKQTYLNAGWVNDGVVFNSYS